MQVVYILRHGDRLDFELGEENFNDMFPMQKNDSPLSELGHKQAAHVTELLKDDITNFHPTSQFRILSSPFLRCIQTALPIAKELGEHINVDVALNEANILGDINLPTVMERNISELSIDYDSTFVPFPDETFPVGCLHRCVGIHHHLIKDRYSSDSLIIVTHGAFVVGVAAVLLQCNVTDITPASPAGLYKFVRHADSSQWECVFQSKMLEDIGLTKPWPVEPHGHSGTFMYHGDNSEWKQNNNNPYL